MSEYKNTSSTQKSSGKPGFTKHQERQRQQTTVRVGPIGGSGLQGKAKLDTPTPWERRKRHIVRVLTNGRTNRSLGGTIGLLIFVLIFCVF